MASTTTRRWPFSTVSPSATSTATTLPFMGARSSVSDPPPAPGRGGRRVERLAHGEVEGAELEVQGVAGEGEFARFAPARRG